MGKLRHRQVMGLSHSRAMAAKAPSAQVPALLPLGPSRSQADGDKQHGKAAGLPGTASALRCPPCATPKTAPPVPAIIPRGEDEMSTVPAELFPTPDGYCMEERSARSIAATSRETAQGTATVLVTQSN